MPEHDGRVGDRNRGAWGGLENKYRGLIVGSSCTACVQWYPHTPPTCGSLDESDFPSGPMQFRSLGHFPAACTATAIATELLLTHQAVANESGRSQPLVQSQLLDIARPETPVSLSLLFTCYMLSPETCLSLDSFIVHPSTYSIV